MPHLVFSSVVLLSLKTLCTQIALCVKAQVLETVWEVVQLFSIAFLSIQHLIVAGMFSARLYYSAGSQAAMCIVHLPLASNYL